MDSRLAAAAAHLLTSGYGSGGGDPISRATSPGLLPRVGGGGVGEGGEYFDPKRYRPRTFSYHTQLPFGIEDDAYRGAALDGILRQLYIALEAEDFAPGAIHWTRELQAWLNLKFDMPRELRARLAMLYYKLALAAGLDPNTVDRFVKTTISLTR